MTGTQLFNMSMDLLGMTLPNGSVPNTVSDLSGRAVSIINTLIFENNRLNQLITHTATAPTCIASLNDVIPLCDRITMWLLPPALAASLISTEDSSVAAFFQNKYINSVIQLKKELPALSGSVIELY